MYQRERIRQEEQRRREIAEQKRHHYQQVFAWLDQARDYGYQEKGFIRTGQDLLDEVKLAWEIYGFPEAQKAQLFEEKELNFEEGKRQGKPVNPWIRAWFNRYCVARLKRQHLDEFKYYRGQEYYIPLMKYLGVKIVEIKRKGPRWLDWRAERLTGSK